MASQIRLAPSASGDSVQAFPLRKGLVNISTGVVTDPDTGLRPHFAISVDVDILRIDTAELEVRHEIIPFCQRKT